jgi:formate/nitrite transporter FocA (FNT family)
VLGCQQLFTETTLTAVLPLLARRKWKTATSTFRSTLRFWTVVLLANLFGTYLFALCVGRSPIFRRRSTKRWRRLSRGYGEGGFGAGFVRAVFAGWLIGLGGFNQVIAGSTKFMFLVIHAEAWPH